MLNILGGRKHFESTYLSRKHFKLSDILTYPTYPEFTSIASICYNTNVTMRYCYNKNNTCGIEK